MAVKELDCLYAGPEDVGQILASRRPGVAGSRYDASGRVSNLGLVLPDVGGTRVKVLK